MKYCCRCLRKPSPLFLIVVTPQSDVSEPEAEKIEGDSEIELLKRRLLVNFAAIETILTKRLIKGV